MRRSMSNLCFTVAFSKNGDAQNMVSGDPALKTGFGTVRFVIISCLECLSELCNDMMPDRPKYHLHFCCKTHVIEMF